MNEKENYEKIFKFFESLQTQLMNESVGFEICKTIDLNERINFMDYENELLIYGINYRSSLLKSAPLNDSKVNVRGLLEFLKKEGLKYGRNPIPVYKKGTYRKKINDNYIWIMNNLAFLVDIFKIRIENYEEKGRKIQSSLTDYKKYLSEEGLKIAEGKDGSEMTNCPYCLKKIQNDSVICSFCGSNISDTNE